MQFNSSSNNNMIYDTNSESNVTSSGNNYIKNIIKDEIISVTQLNKLAKALLENNMPICWISGELSSVKTYSHVYFDLKDDNAKISCVLFATYLKTIDFKLENGVKVEVRGKISIYGQNGSYQINVERIRKVGIGELWEAYNRLLNKLKLEGLFAHEYKKPLPIFPSSVGVVTSKESAVIRDVITTLKRRMPNIPIIIYHTAVQGVSASMQIAKAIKIANERREVDVLIVCRGGGSIEDLWSFNEEVVAREVYASNIPLVSAVGHETDTTIIDFVADVRAPTPTAAAELVTQSQTWWKNFLNENEQKLLYNTSIVINNKKQLLDSYLRQLNNNNPINKLQTQKQIVDNYHNLLKRQMINVLNINHNKLNILLTQLNINNINFNQYQMQLNYQCHKLSNNINRIIII